MKWAQQVRDNPEAERFEIEHAGKVAVAEYRREGNKVTFTHTVVPVEFRGMGIGTALVRGALAAVRREGLKVIPSCSFFARYMREHPETHDLLA
jgi:predicted GNAT family acetyltransferase